MPKNKQKIWNNMSKVIHRSNNLTFWMSYWFNNLILIVAINYYI